MILERVYCMPSRWTFKMRPIRRLLEEEMADSEPWLDPFAGKYSPAHMTNDLDETMPAVHHYDALVFLQTRADEAYVGGLFDPPYTLELARRRYNNHVYKCTASFSSYISKCKKELARKIRPGGKAICCGWNSNGLGYHLGYRLDRVLMVAHGALHYDTIVTVETRVQTAISEEAPR